MGLAGLGGRWNCGDGEEAFRACHIPPNLFRALGRAGAMGGGVNSSSMSPGSLPTGVSAFTAGHPHSPACSSPSLNLGPGNRREGGGDSQKSLGGLPGPSLSVGRFPHRFQPRSLGRSGVIGSLLAVPSPTSSSIPLPMGACLGPDPVLPDPQVLGHLRLAGYH